MDELGFYKSEVDRLERRNASLEGNTYAAPHVWNLVAKAIRENYRTQRGNNKAKLTYNAALTDLALTFAKRFTEDDGFDPVAWLDKCSPDPEQYPFSELWEEDV